MVNLPTLCIPSFKRAYAGKSVDDKERAMRKKQAIPDFDKYIGREVSASLLRLHAALAFNSCAGVRLRACFVQALPVEDERELYLEPHFRGIDKAVHGPRITSHTRRVKIRSFFAAADCTTHSQHAKSSRNSASS